MNNYDVIFEGNISSGFKIQDVKKNLAALFKIDEKKVDTLFAKSQVVLKKGLDHDSALKYRKALLKTGAICNVKAVAGRSGAHPVERAVPPDAAAQALKQTVPPPIASQTPISLTEDTANLEAGSSAEASVEKTPLKGIGDIIAGVVLIAIGFTFGGSVFLGNPGLLDYFFDGLGIFWIGRGIFKMVRK